MVSELSIWETMFLQKNIKNFSSLHCCNCFFFLLQPPLFTIDRRPTPVNFFGDFFFPNRTTIRFFPICKAQSILSHCCQLFRCRIKKTTPFCPNDIWVLQATIVLIDATTYNGPSWFVLPLRKGRN